MHRRELDAVAGGLAPTPCSGCRGHVVSLWQEWWHLHQVARARVRSGAWVVRLRLQHGPAYDVSAATGSNRYDVNLGRRYGVISAVSS